MVENKKITVISLALSIRALLTYYPVCSCFTDGKKKLLWNGHFPQSCLCELWQSWEEKGVFSMSGVISKLLTRVGSVLTGEGVSLCLHPTILKKRRSCFGEGIINRAKPEFSLWQNQLSAFPFPWYPGIGNRLLEGKGDWALWWPDWGWGRMEQRVRPCFLLGLGRTVQEGEQTDGCCLSLQISLMPSSLFHPPHGDSSPFLPPPNHSHYESPRLLPTRHPFLWLISVNWFEVIRVYQTAQMIQIAICFSSA